MINVIVIDDSEIIRERLTDMLDDIKGVKIIGESASAMDGFDLIRKNQPDFVILDIRLPDISGMNLIKYIKKSNPHTQIAMLTNYPYASYRTRCTELGADYFFDKSKEFDQLPEIMANLIQQESANMNQDNIKEEAKKKVNVNLN